MGADSSILTDVKESLGITSDYKVFDNQIMMHINSILMVLSQIGVGPEKSYTLATGFETWRDYLGDKVDELPSVKTYICLRVRLLFDPPTSSVLGDAIKKQIDELEWRLTITSDEK